MGSNIHCILKLWRSVHFSKQAKQMLTVQFEQSQMEVDWTDHTIIQLTWQGIGSADMVSYGDDTWQGDWAYRHMMWQV
jgi:hypothetical protein